ncbi:DUF2231 domain-containing protein [Subtercola sp. RTI3]|uniref:DUF2231 domain-containing protein n=1 Tax=Subtercola sp. RTI3 TaxID=3048639 RepID=UPI002B234479|nr:DUF2231 domain-containing protein [Subtercola sp. RTI3]MEA9985795.1 hypothetical protein [Subtercola sp. RTI3]
MFDTFFGLPLHPFIVHATEVIVPLAAVLVILTAAWPRSRRWSGYLTLATSLVALVLVPISKESGEKLEARVGSNDLIEAHSELADGFLPWVIGLVVVAAALLWFNLRERRTRASVTTDAATTPEVKRARKWIPVTLLVLAVIIAGGTTVQAVLIGHTGSTAVWSEDMASQ